MTSLDVSGSLIQAGVQHFTWAIDNFCERINKKKLISPVHNGNWKLVMYPGCTYADEGCLSLFIYNLRDTQIEATVKFSLLHDDLFDVEREYQFKHKFSKYQSWGTPGFVEQSIVMDPRNRLLTNGVLIIKCEVIEKKDQDIVVIEKEKSYEDNTLEETILTEEEKDLNLTKEKDIEEIEISELTLWLKELDFYEDLLENSKYSDINFVISGADIPAHKLLLMARSKIFEEMFNCSQKGEDSKTTIEINDMTPDAFKELLRFIYAGKVRDIDKYAKPLFIAAEKYRVEGLKIKCDKVLCESLTHENALDYLNLADAYNSPNLKHKAVEFVSQHLTAMIKKPEFNMMKHLNSDVIVELFCKTAQRIEVMENLINK